MPSTNPNAPWQESVKPITPEALSPVQPYQMPVQPFQEPPADQYAAQISAIDTNIGALQSETSATETQMDTVTTDLATAMKRLTGESAFRQQKEQALGLPASQQQLTDLTAQLVGLQNEAKAIPLQEEQAAVGRGRTLSVIEGRSRAALRENAIKSLGVASTVAALQGNIALAQQQADKAVEAEFGPIRAQLDYLGKVYDMNRDRLQREDTLRSQRIGILLDERKRLLQQAEEDKRTIYGITAEAARLGNAPAIILSRATQASSPYEALNILSPYLVDVDAKAQALLDQELARERILSEQADRRIAKLKADSDIKLTNAQIAKLEADMKAPRAVDAKEYQYKANLFAQRLSTANQILEANTSTIKGYNPIKYAGDTMLENTTIGNATVVPPTIQQQRQAERNFLNAVLRRESGAVIAPSEFAEGAKQYFPRPGDSDEVLQAKAQNRQIVISSLESEAGSALQMQQEPQPQAFIGKDGKRYVQGADGLYYAQ